MYSYEEEEKDEEEEDIMMTKRGRTRRVCI